MLGLRLIYLDAGSGANEEVPPEMIAQLRKSINVPLIVGGGINTTTKVNIAFHSGADLIVLGTAVEKKMNFIFEAARIRDQING